MPVHQLLTSCQTLHPSRMMVPCFHDLSQAGVFSTASGMLKAHSGSENIDESCRRLLYTKQKLHTTEPSELPQALVIDTMLIFHSLSPALCLPRMERLRKRVLSFGSHHTLPGKLTHKSSFLALCLDMGGS